MWLLSGCCIYVCEVLFCSDKLLVGACGCCRASRRRPSACVLSRCGCRGGDYRLICDCAVFSLFLGIWCRLVLFLLLSLTLILLSIALFLSFLLLPFLCRLFPPAICFGVLGRGCLLCAGLRGNGGRGGVLCTLRRLCGPHRTWQRGKDSAADA